jgi:hypothetical protein
LALGEPEGVQVTPESVEVKTGLKYAAATNLVPSAEEATDCHLKPPGGPVAVHVIPESAEVNMPAPSSLTATNLVPSDEQAIELQVATGVLLDLQVAPPSVEVKMLVERPPAANVFPSAEEAMECQSALGALDGVQVAPELVEV